MLNRESSQIILWEDSLVNLKKFKNELKSEKQGVLIPVSYTHLTLPTNREV